MASDVLDLNIRPATVDDAKVLAHHRCAMFHDMGLLPDASDAEFEALTEEFFRNALPGNEWFAWVATVADEVVSGGVLYFSVMPPRTLPSGGYIGTKPQGLVMNIYVEPNWRRKGIASAVLNDILAFAKGKGAASVTLHASRDGRHVYEAMGFKPTNEMRLFL